MFLLLFIAFLLLTTIRGAVCMVGNPKYQKEFFVSPIVPIFSCAPLDMSWRC